MRWPWQIRERRDSGGDFSDTVIRLIEAQAAGSAADASSTAAVEAASGALSRAFASAEVVGPAWVAGSRLSGRPGANVGATWSAAATQCTSFAWAATAWCG